MTLVLQLLLLVALASSPAGSQASRAADEGCLCRHSGIQPMHAATVVKLSCTDCHGGNGTTKEKTLAHVQPRNAALWNTSANPPRTYTALLRESPEFVRFINPGDLRVAAEVCGRCHPSQVNAVPRSTMTTAAVFWEAVAYADGIVSRKPGLPGETYDRAGKAQALKPATPPTPEQIAKGALPLIVPPPNWEITQPGEYFRAFERGGIANNTIPPEIGNPKGEDEPART